MKREAERHLRTAGVALMFVLGASRLLFAGGGAGEECAEACLSGECVHEGCFNNCVGTQCAFPCGCSWNAPQQQETCDTPAEQECFDDCVTAAEAWQEKNSAEYGFCE